MTKLRQLWLLTALGSLAVLVGGYFLLVSPKANTAAALREETDTQLQVNRQLQSQIDQLNKQKKELPRLQAELSEFRRKVPSNPALPKLVRSLSDAADRAGVHLLGVSPALPTLSKAAPDPTGTTVAGETVAGPNNTVLVDIPVTITLTGKYSQVSQFFKELEDLERAINIPSFSIEPNKEGKSTADLDVLNVSISSTVVMTSKAPASAKPSAPAADSAS